MLIVNDEHKSIAFSVKKMSSVEDLIAILMANGYYVRLRPYDNEIIVEIKEDKNNGN